MFVYVTYILLNLDAILYHLIIKRVIMSQKRSIVQAFGRRTSKGVLPVKVTVLDVQVPVVALPSPAKVIKRKRVPQAELNAWITDFIQQYFVPFTSLTIEKRDAQAQEPQHFEDGTTNEKWKFSRSNKVSGTKASKLTNLHDYTNFEDGLVDILWDRFSEIMKQKPEIAWKVKWGHDLEPMAAQTTLEFLQSKTGHEFLAQFPHAPKAKCIKVEHKEYGFVQSIALPFIGSSPDGVMECTYEDGTIRRHEVEFKCKTKGWYRNAWPTNEWPDGPLYPIKLLPGGKRFPIPTAYYVQIMWCVLVMGKHDLSSLLGIKGNSAHFEAFTQYLEPHMAKAKSMYFGEDMLDASAPIMFTVWAPGNTDDPHEGEPIIYRRMCFDYQLNIYRSVMVKCPSGCVNMTMVDYDHEFAIKTMQHAYYVWRTHWIPRLAMKTKGMLLKNELDPPMNCFTDSDTDSEEDEETDETEDPEETQYAVFE